MLPRPTALPLLAVLALPAPALAAPCPAPVQDSGPRERDGGDRGRKLLLHLAGGGVLRTRAREAPGGRWEVLRDGVWVALPAGSVERAVPERDALLTARDLERELGRDPDPLRRVAYCDWLVGAGLLAEALAELDGVLADAPDLAPARALATDERLRLALPDLRTGADQAALERFLGGVAGAGPVVRERAVARLAVVAGLADGSGAATPRAAEVPDSTGAEGASGAPELAALVPVLRDQLADPRPARRELAAFALRRLLPGRELRELLRRSLLDPARDVRREANRALRDASESAVHATLVQALDVRHDDARRHAVEALADLGERAAVAPLVSHLRVLASARRAAGAGSGVTHADLFVGRYVAYVGDYDVEVAQGAAIADPVVGVVGEGAGLTAGVVAVSQAVLTRESVVTRKALEHLTGLEPGRSTRAWLDWWDENGDAWSEAHPPPRAAASPEGPGGG